MSLNPQTIRPAVHQYMCVVCQYVMFHCVLRSLYHELDAQNQVFRAFCPRVRPSVPSMAMVRTMFSPVTRVSLLQVWLSIWLIPLWGNITGIKSLRFDDFGDLQMTSNYPKKYRAEKVIIESFGVGGAPINLFRMSV